MTSEPTVTDLDRTIGFTIPARHARGRMVRLGPVLDAVLAAHAYPPPIEKLLAEALTLAALIGSTLKDAGGQLTLQTQGEAGDRQPAGLRLSRRRSCGAMSSSTRTS